MKIIFYSNANETHFHKEGFALENFESESYWNSDMVYFPLVSKVDKKIFHTFTFQTVSRRKLIKMF